MKETYEYNDIIRKHDNGEGIIKTLRKITTRGRGICILYVYNISKKGV